MNPRALSCLLLLSLVPAPARTQSPQVPARAAVQVGLGNHYGWLGIGGEAYLISGRLSALAGIGFIPRGLFDFPTTIAGAVGVRYYAPLGASHHRAFVDLSVSVLEVSQAAMIGAPVIHDYGPGVSIGYSYVAQSGFTFTAGAGAGRANYETVPVIHLGVGWTWLHR